MDSKLDVEHYVGKKFNKLTILKYESKNKYYKIIVEVQCDCENKTIFNAFLDNIKNGHTKSCGCYKKENMVTMFKKYNTYDLTGEYGIGYTTKGEEFYFDLEDYDKIKDICWNIDSKKYVKGG